LSGKLNKIAKEKSYAEGYGRIKNPTGRPTPTGREEFSAEQPQVWRQNHRQITSNLQPICDQSKTKRQHNHNQPFAMNEPDEDKIRAALASAASRNQSLRRRQFDKLMKYKELIRDLRSQDASFVTIEKLLRTHSFHVSHETIRAFYRQAIEEKPLKRKYRRRNQKAKNQKAKSKVPAMAAKTWNIGQPRIANIDDL
jgi:hypothetical protein